MEDKITQKNDVLHTDTLEELAEAIQDEDYISKEKTEILELAKSKIDVDAVGEHLKTKDKIIESRICLAHFRKGENCSKDCQWYHKDSSCPNGIDKNLLDEIKKATKQEIVEEIEKEIKASKNNLKYQRDITKNDRNTKSWEDIVFGEELILNAVEKYFNQPLTK